MTDGHSPENDISERTKLMVLSQDSPILFFDGICSLCNSSVDWVMSKDSAGKFRFTSLQGKAAESIIPASDRARLSTVILLKKGRLYHRTDAVVETLLELPGLWPRLGRWLSRVPKFLRNLGYALVARNRYRVFGKRETCRLPSPGERARFID